MYMKLFYCCQGVLDNRPLIHYDSTTVTSGRRCDVSNFHVGGKISTVNEKYTGCGLHKLYENVNGKPSALYPDSVLKYPTHLLT